MFTRLVPANDNILFRVDFSDYSERHFLKYFEKKYPKKDWGVTVESIKQELSRIGTTVSDLQKSSQVDELWSKDNRWIFKYDFRVAKTKFSAKSSGNRIVAFLDRSKNVIEILMIYDKICLPKNKSETDFIRDTIKENFPEYWESCR